jgi:putative membrane protein
MAPDQDIEIKPEKPSNANAHMANERTFLAWIRTSIGIMAFGFVVERFALFTSQVAEFLGKPIAGSQGNVTSAFKGLYTSYGGIFLVALGSAICLLAFIKYKQVEKQLDEGSYRPSILLDVMLTLSVLLVGISLFIYLIHSL